MISNIQQQFGNIYDQYIEKIYRFVYIKVNSREIAEDITSKVFLKGWEAYSAMTNDQFPMTNMAGYLYKIARNAVIDYYREKGKAKMANSEILPVIADTATDFRKQAELSADVLLVKVAMQKLSPDAQDAIIWRYLDGLAIPEIALAMDKPEGTVRVMIHRGLRALKSELEGKVDEV